MTNDIKQKIIKEVAELSGQGLRCLAIAEVPNAGKLSGVTDENKSQILSDISKYSEQE